MRRSINLAFSCLLLVAGSVQGASSVDLSISATTNPAGCDIRLDNGGRMDYGILQRSDLNADGTKDTNLGTKNTGFSINCDYPVLIAVHWTDNHAGYGSAPSGTSFFSLGKDGKGAPIGAFSLAFVNGEVVADSNVVETISRFAGDASGPWIRNITGIVDNRFVLGFASPGTGLPGAFAVYSGQISVSAHIAPLNTLDLTRSVELDGSATVEVIYL